MNGLKIHWYYGFKVRRVEGIIQGYVSNSLFGTTLTPQAIVLVTHSDAPGIRKDTLQVVDVDRIEKDSFNR